MLKNLLPFLKESMFEPLIDLGEELAEVGIDGLLKSEIIKQIPIAKTIMTACSFVYDIHELNLMRQTLLFLAEFNEGTINPEKLTEYKNSLEQDPKKMEKELGRVMIILDGNIDDIKSIVLGKLYCGYINKEITWEKFCELTEANNRMFINDYTLLLEADENNGINIEKRELYQVDRLISLGFLQNQNRLGGNIVVMIDELTEKDVQKDIIITSFGKEFCKYIHNINGLKAT